MNLLKKLLCRIFLAIALIFLVPITFAANTFIINHIKIEGLQRVSEATVLSYLPVQIGQRYSPDMSTHILEILYNTQFFSDVRLFRRNNTLIVWVQEEPTIGLISITGNKSVPKKALKKVLNKLGIVEGNVFNDANLQQIVVGLKQEYGMLGHYSATVQASVKPEPRNRVAIYIEINEGKIAKVRYIGFEGEHVFSERKLREHFTLTTMGLLTFFTHTDLYSKVKLDQSLQALQEFYYDHGYLKFRVISKQVEFTPDHSGVYIHIHVYEGPVYHISGYKVVGEDIDKARIEHLITLHPGDVFSRSHMLAINSAIAHEFSNHGFAFPDIRMVPSLNEQNQTVFVTFYIQKGHLVYIRHINFTGNHRTQDGVLRFQMRQMEGARFNLSKIQESKRRLANLPFLQNITVTPVPVLGHPDEADLNYHVKEIDAGKISVQGGWAEDYGLLYGASISEPNFMGTGRFTSLSFQRSDYSTNYDFSYDNPFYTIYGMSRGFNIYFTQMNPSRNKVNFENSYDMNDFGGQVFYGLPITQFTTFDFGYGYDYIKIFDVDTNTISPDVRVFLQNFGFNPANPTDQSFHQFSGNLGLTRVTLNRAVFPTDGSVQKLILTAGAPITSRSPGFAKVTYVGHWFFPLGHGFVINPHTQLGYGVGFGKSGLLPFWQNFYAGGITTLPGYEPNTLGPINALDDGTAIGGNVEMLGGLDFIFPNFISDKLRTAFILDAGNIFLTDHDQYTAAQIANFEKGHHGHPPPPINYENVSLANLRVTAGLMVSWYSPLGPINVSIAFPLNKKPGDETQIFGFTFGTSV